MRKTSVAVLYGGRGKEHEVSKKSASHILALIDKKRYAVHPIFITKGGKWYYRGNKNKPVTLAFSAPRLMVGGEALHVDAVLPILHGDRGEDGSISGLLDCIGLPYAGCRAGASALCIDKAFTKAVARTLGIPTAKDILVCGTDDLPSAIRRAESEIGYPMFIKPADLGSSVGASAVFSKEEIEGALRLALSLSARVLIEELIAPKRELECAYLRTREREYISAPAEVLCDGTYDYRKKYSRRDGAKTQVRADLPEEAVLKVREYTAALARYIGIRQLCRADYFLTPGGIMLNEINTLPGFTAASLYARMLEGEGIQPQKLITELIEGAKAL